MKPNNKAVDMSMPEVYLAKDTTFTPTREQAERWNKEAAEPAYVARQEKNRREVQAEFQRLGLRPATAGI